MSAVIPIDEKYALTAFDLPKGSKEIIKFLRSYPGAMSFLNKIPRIIRDMYGNVKISLHIHTDPEEGWERLILTIFSGINDPDELTQREDALFNRLAQDDALSDGLRICRSLAGVERVFDPVDFYHLASKLHTDASDESTLRSSVSRGTKQGCFVILPILSHCGAHTRITRGAYSQTVALE